VDARTEPRSRRPYDQRGLSIIELMIGMTIGLIGALAIVQVFSQSEIHRRATGGAADAQQAGTLASWRLMRDLRMAGSSMQHGATVWGCPLQVWRQGDMLLPRSGGWPAPFVGMPSDLPLTPFAVRDGGGSIPGPIGPDQILAMSGRSGAGPVPLPVTIVSSSVLNASTSVGFNPLDFLLLTVTGEVRPCRLGQIDASYAAVPGAAAPSAVPTGALGTEYNGPSGFGDLPRNVDYSLFNLGTAPSIMMHGVLNNQLVQYDVLQLGGVLNPVVQAENVENLQVIYGVDDGASGGVANDNIVDRWVSPAAAGFDFDTMIRGGAATLQVKAIRMAVVVRSSEASQSQGPAALVLFPDLPDVAALPRAERTLSYTGRERMYSRQVYDLAIPLRNQAVALCSDMRRGNNVPAAGSCD
jgi:type IV pilus assembly protein PilW